jgi:DNA-binding IclR family transcriptional regulator
MGRKGGGRSLGTARAVLRVLAHLAQRPDGVTVNEVAVFLGKSSWTARYLLNSLLHEGFAERIPRSARIRLTGRGVVIAGRRPDRAGSLGSAPAPPPAGDPGDQDLREALEELSLRTRQRGYLVLLDQDVPTVADVVGKRGLPAMKGIRPALVREAHALAVGKAIIAHLPRAAVDAYVEQCGLPGFTPATITGLRWLLRELEGVRAAGYALDREEFEEGFCCIAAPVFGPGGSVVGSLGISMPARRFAAEGRELAGIVRTVARQVSPRWPGPGIAGLPWEEVGRSEAG